MSHRTSPLPTQIVHLTVGAKAVINGALVSAREPCTLEVAAGAYVLTGRDLWPPHKAPRNPCDELYFSLLDCAGDEGRFHEERFRLFALLGAVASESAPHANQTECSQCAAALMAGNTQNALEIAARMASSALANGPMRSLAGAPVERRRALSHDRSG